MSSRHGSSSASPMALMKSLTTPLSSSCRADILMAIRMFRPSRFQAAAWRAASRITHTPSGEIRPESSAAAGLPRRRPHRSARRAWAGSTALGGSRPAPCAGSCPTTRSPHCGGPCRAGKRGRYGAPLPWPRTWRCRRCAPRCPGRRRGPGTLRCRSSNWCRPRSAPGGKVRAGVR
ncbi:hypothetical protein G6F68_014440 [Rhizopus microsporus]|nr:hypothetical protein G6F68_014440 [Rhizopus microsporus]